MSDAIPRVAVTGLGLMTGLGLDLESSWRGLVEGRNPVRRFTLFDPGDLPCTFGVELPAGAEEVFARQIARRSRTQMTRGTQIALVTAQMAAADAGLRAEAVDGRRVGVVAGTTGTGYAPPPGPRDEHRILRNMSSAPAAWISLKGGWAGPSLAVGTACSSGAYALAVAFDLLVSGQCDAVIAGAADSSINYPDVEGFCGLLALSEQKDDIEHACRPFDRRRNGFVMGEGGGFVVLETLESVRRRGARVRAELSRPGLCSEAYNILAPQPGGEGMAVCMEQALRWAGLRPDDIGYINAHGTSTPINDACETQAIRRVFGDAANRLAVSSTKSMTGHCLSGAAGVEAVISCLALQEGVIPPTINLTEPDPELGLDFVPLTARRQPLRHVLSNAFAFGGQNGAIIVSQPG